MFSFESDLYNEALVIVQTLSDAGFKAYLAGGAVRDMLLSVKPSDIDIATDATPEQISRLFVNSKHVGAAFGVVIVKVKKHKFEVATFRKDKEYLDGRHPNGIEFTSPEEDAKRRDFTINGMFFDPVNNEIIDFVGGQQDLRDQVLRAIGDADTRFSEDYLRMIRAIRFASRLNFIIEDKTWQSMLKNAHNVANLAVERVREELTICFMGKNPDIAFQLMLDSGILEIVMPDVAKMHGIEQPEEFHPEGDVFEHTKLMLRQLADDSESIENGQNLKGALPKSESLVWAVILHDVGKPVTMRIKDRIRFDGHAKKGAEIADKICERLKFSNIAREKIVGLVRNHMHFMEVPNMKLSTFKKFLQTDNFDELLALHRLDCLGSRSEKSKVDFIYDKIAEIGESEIKPLPLLTGNEIIGLGFEKGRIIGEILKAVEIQQLEGTIKTREEAISFVQTNFKKDKKS